MGADLWVGMNAIYYADNLEVLRALPSGSIDLIVTDPPFNTRKPRTQTTLRVERAADGPRRGFGGQRYRVTALTRFSFPDRFDDYLGFLEPRLVEFHRVLAPHGSLYLHLDYREAHYCKVLLDLIFGRACFLNEIIWAYDYGGRSRRRWPAKHDTILLYVRDRRRYYFDADAVERVPYLAPGLVGPEKAARGKLPTDTWWHTIVPTSSKERTGYPTQKPLALVRRMVAASAPAGGLVLDPFAGSGTVGAACLELGRRFLLVDNNLAAIQVMARRFAGREDIAWYFWNPTGASERPEEKPA